MTEDELAALKEAGPDLVLQKLNHAGPGRTAAVPGFKVRGGCITRGDCEDWLTGERAKKIRNDKSTVIWARIGKIGTTCVAIATIAATIWPQEIGRALTATFATVRSFLGI